MIRAWDQDPYNHLEYGPASLMFYAPLLPETGVKFTINGTTRPLQPGFRISEVLSSRNTMSFRVLALDGSWRPSRGQSVLFRNHDTGHTYFAGHVHTVTEHGFAGKGTSALEFDCTAVDHNALADRRLVELTIPSSNTLKQALTTLVTNYLDDYGVTLDAAQVDGPTLSTLVDADLDFTFPTSVTDVLNKLQGVTENYAWNIDNDKVLSMFAIGTTSTTPTPESYVIGDIAVTTTSDTYANYNYITVQWTEPAVQAYNFFRILTASNLSDGDTEKIGGKTYTFDATLVDSPYHVQIGGSGAATLSNFIDAVMDTGTPGTDYGTGTDAHTEVEMFSFSGDSGWETAKIRALDAGAAGNAIQTENGVGMDESISQFITEGAVIVSTLKLGLDAALTGKAIADGGAAAADRVDRNYAHPEITETSFAQVTAETYLARDSAAAQTTRFRTDTLVHSGVTLAPGIALTFVAASRNLTGSHVVTNVDTSANGNVFQHDVTMVKGTTVVPKHELSLFKTWSKQATT